MKKEIFVGGRQGGALEGQVLALLFSQTQAMKGHSDNSSEGSAVKLFSDITNHGVHFWKKHTEQLTELD